VGEILDGLAGERHRPAAARLAESILNDGGPVLAGATERREFARLHFPRRKSERYATTARLAESIHNDGGPVWRALQNAATRCASFPAP